ncbi:hypothetical protein OOP60_004875 [Salmonella enterica]|nr:hypothetical protein [Salmonella enterica]EKB5476463.1 hypothetical protein [Salmonella enterica]ELL0516240.1 hypothetical protein [Salmonella enterica]
MSRQKEKIVMMDSDEAASIRTLTGWVDRQGRFWGNDEYQARWCGATHRKCKNKPEEHPILSTVSWSGSDRVAIVSDDMLTDEQKAEIMAERTA